jgi:undecaprenyl-diphosphatase
MKRLLTSCFGLGFLPAAPGTWGSVGAAVLYVLLAHYCSGTVTGAVLIAGVLFGSFVCVRFAPAIVEATGCKDPREVVADEFAGQCLAFFIVGLFSLGDIWTTTVWVFMLFRVFDVVKPWPCRKLEGLREGWGILTDDLAAGVYAGLLFQICLWLGFVEWASGIFGGGQNGLSVGFAALLGAIQGLTEFLPVSSSGHLVLFESLNSNISADSAEMLLFDIAIHVGTVGAICAVYYKSIRGMLNNLCKATSYGSSPIEIYRKSPSVRLLVLAAAATVTTVVIYGLFKEPLESGRRLGVVAAMWVVTATVLLVTDMKKTARKGIREFGILAAVIVGAAQAAAILPGISRSGATICVAILLGLHRRWAVEFSLLISVPAIIGAAVLKFVQDFASIGSGNLSFAAFAVGMIVSFLVGIIALRVLIMASRRRRLKYFATYCYILAFFVLVYLLS